MNWKTFTAMLARDAHVARRNVLTLVLQTMLQPLLFMFIFGQVMIRSGMMNTVYRSILLPGIMATTMLMAGIQAVSMPVIIEFMTKEIEDRLLAPMHMRWLVVEKIVAGMAISLLSGLFVLPVGWLIMGRNTGATLEHSGLLIVIMLLVALLSASSGLVMGCSVGQAHIGLLFSMVLAPMIMFGCAYYPWSALQGFPILRWAVLINPMVYASEGLRSALAPQVAHMPLAVVISLLCAMNLALVMFGINRFYKKAVT